MLIGQRLQGSIQHAIAGGLRIQPDPPARIALDDDELVSVHAAQEEIRDLQAAAVLELDDQVAAGTQVSRQRLTRNIQQEIHGIDRRGNAADAVRNRKIAVTTCMGR
ncbi:hypothetical protein [Comamonas endophytica]|uniref:Uncharacterized protein n=1 Tax=Comamonas endophytica TaxID=2949090 RepID=A0ABY6GCV2_9BURK|nr:hypothetical protein [Acidovorax sp. 5MLIR]UYG52530.1 hypothetical protein M9799_04625 [Acidovorax sp. 5MLIR]